MAGLSVLKIKLSSQIIYEPVRIRKKHSWSFITFTSEKQCSEHIIQNCMFHITVNLTNNEPLIYQVPLK